MNKTCISLLLLFFSFALFAQEAAQMNVMSFNIRYDNSGDGNNQWKYRRDYAANLVKFYSPDIFGAQEVLHNQLTDLTDRLPEYAYIGVGREDGKTKGEYAPVFYKKDRLKLIDSGNFWLAEDMNAVGKKGWDAACERVATWGIFEDVKTGKRFLFLNTHLDHMGEVARHEGALLVLKQVDKLAAGMPAIVTGDFNASAYEEPIQVLLNGADNRHLTDSRDVAALRYGPEGSWHDFGKVPLERMNLIDYIFIKGNMKVMRHGVLSEAKGKLFPSDHYPVLATLIVE